MNPYAPVRIASPRAPRPPAQISFPLRRLQRLGASSTELAAMREAWEDQENDEARLAAASELDAMTDDEVRAGLLDLREAMTGTRAPDA